MGDFKITDLKARPILILDFGSQYTQLIARRLREMHVYCEIHSFLAPASLLDELKPCGIILSGGPSTATLASNPRAPEWIFTAQLPILGICYGMQTMAAQLGGAVASSESREFGHAQLTVLEPASLFAGVTYQEPQRLDVWMSHGDKVTTLPPDFITLCTTPSTPIAGMAHVEKPWFGLQFHPEVTHTPQGMALLKYFALNICKAATNWTAETILAEKIIAIREQVGTDKVLLGLSGGVDSSVVAALLHKAIGSQLTCVFVDTGLLRLNEMQQVQTMFAKQQGMQIIWVDAAKEFFTALAGQTCSETKRKIIGHLFIKIFEREAKKLDSITWLAQGTIYSDVIESALSNAASISEVIKSHHNGCLEHPVINGWTICAICIL